MDTVDLVKAHRTKLGCDFPPDLTAAAFLKRDHAPFLARLCDAAGVRVPEGVSVCLFKGSIYRRAAVGDDARLFSDTCVWRLCIAKWGDDVSEGEMARALAHKKEHAAFYFRLLFMLDSPDKFERWQWNAIRWSSDASLASTDRALTSSNPDRVRWLVEHLPEKAALAIFRLLAAQDLPRVGQVCKDWNVLFLDPSVVLPLMQQVRFGSY